MNAMFDTVVRHDAAFDVLEFRIGRTNDEPSFVSMRVTAKAPDALTEVLEALVAMMRSAKQAGYKIAFVAGPVVVHTGGGDYFRDLIRNGYVNVLLAGNALAVHDVEQALYGTSLGVDMETGRAIEGGHRHHMRAINAIYRAGRLRAAVEQGVLTSGVMYECIKRNVDYVLAGSIRDDGPLPDTVA